MPSEPGSSPAYSKRKASGMARIMRMERSALARSWSRFLRSSSGLTTREKKKDGILMVTVPAASGQIPLVALMKALGMENDKRSMTP